MFERQRQEYQQNFERQTRWEKELQSSLKKYLDENTVLRDLNTRIENAFNFSQREIIRCREEAEQAQSQVQLLEAKLEELKHQVESHDSLKKQIETLSKEILFRDDEDEKRAGLVNLLNNQLRRKLDQAELAAKYSQLELEMEKQYSSLLETKVVELETRVVVAEQLAAARDTALLELKKTFEIARGVAQAQLGSVEEKFAAVRNVNVALENRILEYHAEKEKLARNQGFSGRSSRSSSLRTSSGDETGHTSDRYSQNVSTSSNSTLSTSTMNANFINNNHSSNNLLLSD